MNGKDTAVFSKASDEWKKKAPILHRIEEKIPAGRNKWTFRFRGRFKVTQSGCFALIGCRDKDGYGHLSYRNKPIAAHRLSWILHNGELPAGIQVCHKCDNPGCINPGHLFLGTTQENTKDRNDKNRQAKGNRNPFCKLSEGQVRSLRTEYANGEGSIRTLAKKYGVCFATAREAIIGETWGWLK